MNKYLGHPSQISGVEEVSLLRGKGKGMTLLEVRNGLGLELTFSADRVMDISRVTLCGANYGFFSPCGYVAPAYYDKDGFGFLKSFTAGFLTTCGFGNLGAPCTDDGEALPQHGTLANIPCDNYSYTEDDDAIIINATARDTTLFGHHYIFTRQFTISKKCNTVKIHDVVENPCCHNEPCMMLYHFNIGYPLLSENAKLYFPYNNVYARSEHAKKYIDTCLELEKPQPEYPERCYFYDIKDTNGIANVGIYNPDIKKGLKMTYDKNVLSEFVEWKMMGEGEYVLGMEPANATPSGRPAIREQGKLKTLAPGEKYTVDITLLFSENEEDIKA